MAVCYSTEYEWKIQGFSKLNSNIGYRIDSEFRENGDVKSRMGLCPNGNVEQNRGYLSVYLWIGCPIPYDASILFQIRGNDGQYRHNKRREDVIPGNCREGWGFDRFIPRDFVLDSRNGLLENDVLTLKCIVMAAPTSRSLKSVLPSLTIAKSEGNSDSVSIGRDNNGIIINAREFHLHFH